MYSFEEILEQELELELPTFDAELAFKLGMIAVERAKREDKVITVTVSIGRQTIFHYGAVAHGPNADHWLKRKCNVVYEYYMSSLRLGAKLTAQDSSLQIEGRSPKDFTDIGGGVPIRVKGLGVIGAMAITGMPHVEDHDYVCDAIKTLKDEMTK